MPRHRQRGNGNSSTRAPSTDETDGVLHQRITRQSSTIPRSQALDAGSIAGCALDVGRAPDQMPTPGLARHPQVIATPHIGGLTPQSAEHQALETVAQIASLLEGDVPKGAVNAEQATRLARLRAR
jgi:hypothetical protein